MATTDAVAATALDKIQPVRFAPHEAPGVMAAQGVTDALKGMSPGDRQAVWNSRGNTDAGLQPMTIAGLDAANSADKTRPNGVGGTEKPNDGTKTVRTPNEGGGYHETTYGADMKPIKSHNEDGKGNYTEETYDSQGKLSTKKVHKNYPDGASDNVTDAQGNPISNRFTKKNGDWNENTYNKDGSPADQISHVSDGKGGYKEVRSHNGKSSEVTIVNKEGVTKRSIDEKGHVIEVGPDNKISEYEVTDPRYSQGIVEQ